MITEVKRKEILSKGWKVLEGKDFDDHINWHKELIRCYESGEKEFPADLDQFLKDARQNLDRLIDRGYVIVG